MKGTTVFLLSVILFATGCMKWAWRGYDKPKESDYVSLNVSDHCMRIGVQNLNDEQKKAVLEAATEVCKILSSSEFRDSVLARTWLLSCDLLGSGPDEMTGWEVFNILNNNIKDYSINPRKPWRAIAQTQRNENDLVYNRVAISPAQIKKWASTDQKIRGELVNTIAHETMHIISYSFRDRGHGTSACPNERLVSYGIGNLVEKLWLKKVGQ
jgi:hypothetical protein